MFQKQVIMRRVVYSLIPIYLFSIYLYGWRVLTVSAVVFGLGILVEYIVERKRNKKVSEAVLVTCALYSLALPPAIPLWVAGTGIVFAVFMGKEVFGGFGRNIFNPAITGRLFVYITFPTIMDRSWMVAGRFGTLEAGVDTLTAATPLNTMRLGEMPEVLNMFFGLRNGSIGEGSILLILAAAVYLIVTKTANWRLIISTAVSGTLLSAILYYAGASPFPPLLGVMAGSLLFVSVFMATDPVSAPNKPVAQWIYGSVIGTVSVLVRVFAGFPEGTSFGIMIGNTFASLIDEYSPAAKKKKKKKAPAPQAKQQTGNPAAERGAT